MTIQDVINDVAVGELKQLAVKKDTDAVISYINLGLIELYKRFDLKTDEVVIPLSAAQTIYEMPTNFLAIIEALDEAGNWYSINDEDDALSILTPTFNTIQVPNPQDGAAISIIYRALPDRITSVNNTLPLPLSLLDALYNYIGYRGHGAVNGDLKTENNSHYMRFEANCKKARTLGVLTSDDTVNTKLTDRGFV
jgi:hypothetical protein